MSKVQHWHLHSEVRIEAWFIFLAALTRPETVAIKQCYPALSCSNMVVVSCTPTQFWRMLLTSMVEIQHFSLSYILSAPRMEYFTFSRFQLIKIKAIFKKFRVNFGSCKILRIASTMDQTNPFSSCWRLSERTWLVFFPARPPVEIGSSGHVSLGLVAHWSPAERSFVPGDGHSLLTPYSPASSSPRKSVHSASQ